MSKVTVKGRALPIKLRQGDQVKVIAGKDRGKTGTIEAVIPKRQRVVVGGVNVLKKAIKPSAEVKQAGIIEFAAPIHASNVMLIDPKSGERTRIGYRVGSGGRASKVRFAKKSGTELTAAKPGAKT